MDMILSTIAIIFSLIAIIFAYLRRTYVTTEKFIDVENYVRDQFEGERLDNTVSGMDMFVSDIDIFKSGKETKMLESGFTDFEFRTAGDRLDVIKYLLLPSWGPPGTVRFKIEFTKGMEIDEESDSDDPIYILDGVAIYKCRELDIEYSNFDGAVIAPHGNPKDWIYVYINFKNRDDIKKKYQMFLMAFSTYLTKRKYGGTEASEMKDELKSS